MSGRTSSTGVGERMMLREQRPAGVPHTNK